MSRPSNTMRPAVGRSTPVRQLKNVDLPAPFGPMPARSSPRRTSTETSRSAASPPNWTDSPSVRRMTGAPAPRRTSSGATGAAVTVTLCELARDGDDGPVLRDDVQDAVLAAAQLEEELAEERLVVLPAQGLVALGEVVPLLHLQAFQGFDELHRVLAAPESGLLHAHLEGVDALEIRLHVAVGERAARIDLLEPRRRVLEERLVGRRIERALEHGNVAVDADEAVALAADGGEGRRHRDRPIAGDPIFLAEAEIVALRQERDALGTEEDPIEPVEAARDLGQKRRHVGRAEGDARGTDDLAAVLLDLGRERVLRRLPPRVVRERD